MARAACALHDGYDSRQIPIAPSWGMTRSLAFCLLFASACTNDKHHTKPDSGSGSPPHGFSHGPAISSRGSSLDVFGVADSASVYQTSWAGTSWGTWTDSGHPLMSDV